MTTASAGNPRSDRSKSDKPPQSRARQSKPRQSEPKQSRPVQLEFEDNAVLPMLFGAHDRHLARIEQALGVSLHARGNRLAIGGGEGAIASARATVLNLYERARRGEAVDADLVEREIRAARAAPLDEAAAAEPRADSGVIRTRKRLIEPRSPTQRAYVEAIRTHDLTFGLGPAGTGKSYLAVAAAVAAMTAGEVERVVLSRPAVEAGERLGFLPGDMREKVDPYLRPLYDALYDMLPGDLVARQLESGEIEVAPLAFMRGRTLARAFVILDEAQNTTPVQMKMFLTRLGEGARMVVTGDLSQVDLPAGTRSGLADALDTLEGVQGIATVRFTHADIVRHPLVTRIVQAYDARSSTKG